MLFIRRFLLHFTFTRLDGNDCEVYNKINMCAQLSLGGIHCERFHGESDCVFKKRMG